MTALDELKRRASKKGAPILYGQAAIEIEHLRHLVQSLIDNDPMEYVADGGITVLDVWRKDAKRILES